QESWARDLGKKDLPALQGYLDTAPAIAALSSTQTQGNPPAGSVTSALDADTLAVCSMFGNDPDAVAAALKEKA
ncbi:phage protease, partial [Chromobacterium violaceum]